MHNCLTNCRLSPDKFVCGAVQFPMAATDSQERADKKARKKKTAYLKKFRCFFSHLPV